MKRCYDVNGDDERGGFLKSQFLRLPLHLWMTMIVMMHSCAGSEDDERGGCRWTQCLPRRLCLQMTMTVMRKSYDLTRDGGKGGYRLRLSINGVRHNRGTLTSLIWDDIAERNRRMFGFRKIRGFGHGLIVGMIVTATRLATVTMTTMTMRKAKMMAMTATTTTMKVSKKTTSLLSRAKTNEARSIGEATLRKKLSLGTGMMIPLLGLQVYETRRLTRYPVAVVDDPNLLNLVCFHWYLTRHSRSYVLDYEVINAPPAPEFPVHEPVRNR